MNISERLIYECLKQCALNLPTSDYIQPINENDPKTNYINPFVQQFVDTEINLLKWPEVNHRDRIQRTSRRKAADAILYAITQDILGLLFGFAEVKSQKQEKKIRNLTLDLYRLVHFAKDSLDNSNLSNVFLFQSVGSKTTFCMSNLLNEALYCTYELFKIHIPLNYDQITNLTLSDINNLCSLRHLFNQCPITHGRNLDNKIILGTARCLNPNCEAFKQGRACNNRDVISATAIGISAMTKYFFEKNFLPFTRSKQ